MTEGSLERRLNDWLRSFGDRLSLETEGRKERGDGEATGKEAKGSSLDLDFAANEFAFTAPDTVSTLPR